MSKHLHCSSDPTTSSTSSFEGLLLERVFGRGCFLLFFFGYILILSLVRYICGHLDIMKLCRLSVLLFVLHTSLLLLFFSSNISASLSSAIADMAPNYSHIESNECLSATPSNRKLKLQDNEHNNDSRKKNVHVGNVNLYDYSPIDPVPSSKRSIKHGPIEHGSPLIPHMPNPSPPDQPHPGGFV